MIYVYVLLLLSVDTFGYTKSVPKIFWCLVSANLSDHTGTLTAMTELFYRSAGATLGKTAKNSYLCRLTFCTKQNMSDFILTIIGIGGSTLLGAVLGFFIRKVPHRLNDSIIGFCAGIMMAAAIVGLILPAFGMYDSWAEKIIPIVGVFCGAALLTVLDKVTPHLHRLTGMEPEQHCNNERLDRTLLFVLAIALHKLPEGMSAGVGFADGGTAQMATNAVNVAIAISLQNIPEGMVIISPLLLAGVGYRRTFCIAVIVSLLEIAGVLIGYYLGSISVVLLPFMLAFSGGAMLYVVSDEMIPESHAHGYQKAATFALIAGFVLMLLI